MLCTINIDLFKGLKKIVSIGNLVGSPPRWVGESFFDYKYLREFEAKIGTARKVVKGTFFDYKYLREFEAKIGTARKVVKGTHAEPISAKTPENPSHCHVPLAIFGGKVKILLFKLL
jgi:hypothetical protein